MEINGSGSVSIGRPIGMTQQTNHPSTDYLPTNEEELCEYLAQKYQNQLPLTGEAKREFRRDHRLFAETIRQNLVRRISANG
jgi:hypothetical protein